MRKPAHDFVLVAWVGGSLSSPLLAFNPETRVPFGQPTAQRSLLSPLRSKVPEKQRWSSVMLGGRSIDVPEAENITMAVETLQAKGQWREAAELVIDSAPSALDAKVYASVALECGRRKSGDLALNVVRAMRKVGVEMDFVAWNSLISACAWGGEPERALEFLELMQEAKLKPTVFTYNALINACAKKDLFDNVPKLLESMQEDGLKPSVTTFDSLISSCANRGMPEKAEGLLDMMHEAGLKPNVTTYNSLLSAFEKGDMLDRALKAFTSMQDDGLKPDALTFNSLISACAKGGKPEKAQDFLRSMQDGGLQPNSLTYCSLISAWANDGKAEEALDVFASMRKDGLEPDAIVYRSLIRACAKAGKTKQAQELFESMEKDGLVPDNLSYEALLSLLEQGVPGATSSKTDDVQPSSGQSTAGGSDPEIKSWQDYEKALADRSKDKKTLAEAMQGPTAGASAAGVNSKPEPQAGKGEISKPEPQAGKDEINTWQDYQLALADRMRKKALAQSHQGEQGAGAGTPKPAGEVGQSAASPQAAESARETEQKAAGGTPKPDPPSDEGEINTWQDYQIALAGRLRDKALAQEDQRTAGGAPKQEADQVALAKKAMAIAREGGQSAAGGVAQPAEERAREGEQSVAGGTPKPDPPSGGGEINTWQDYQIALAGRLRDKALAQEDQRAAGGAPKQEADQVALAEKAMAIARDGGQSVAEGIAQPAEERARQGEKSVAEDSPKPDSLSGQGKGNTWQDYEVARAERLRDKALSQAQQGDQSAAAATPKPEPSPMLDERKIKTWQDYNIALAERFREKAKAQARQGDQSATGDAPKPGPAVAEKTVAKAPEEKQSAAEGTPELETPAAQRKIKTWQDYQQAVVERLKDKMLAGDLALGEEGAIVKQDESAAGATPKPEPQPVESDLEQKLVEKAKAIAEGEEQGAAGQISAPLPPRGERESTTQQDSQEAVAEAIPGREPVAQTGSKAMAEKLKKALAEPVDQTKEAVAEKQNGTGSTSFAKPSPSLGGGRDVNTWKDYELAHGERSEELENWHKMPEKELHKECLKYGVDVKGDKDALVMRLALRRDYMAKWDARGVPMQRLLGTESARDAMTECEFMEEMQSRDLLNKYKEIGFPEEDTMGRDELLGCLQMLATCQMMTVPMLEKECEAHNISTDLVPDFEIDVELLAAEDARRAMLVNALLKDERMSAWEKRGYPARRIGDFGKVLSLVTSYKKYKEMSKSELRQVYVDADCPIGNGDGDHDLVELIKHVIIWETLPMQELEKDCAALGVVIQEDGISEKEQRHILVRAMLAHKLKSFWMAKGIPVDRLGANVTAALSIIDKFEALSTQALQDECKNFGIPTTPGMETHVLWQYLRDVVVWTWLPVKELYKEVEKLGWPMTGFDMKTHEVILKEQLLVRMMMKWRETVKTPEEDPLPPEPSKVPAESSGQGLAPWKMKDVWRYIKLLRDPIVIQNLCCVPGNKTLPMKTYLPTEAKTWTPLAAALSVLSGCVFNPDKERELDSRDAAADNARALISVICPTCQSRHNLHPLLYENFCRQDYEHKELVVIDTGKKPSKFFQKCASEDDRVVYRHYAVDDSKVNERVSKKLFPQNDIDWSLGLKRNIACQIAKGDVIAQFDDDDLYASNWLTWMRSQLEATASHEGDEADGKLAPAAATLTEWHVMNADTLKFGYIECESDAPLHDKRGWYYGWGFSYMFTRSAWEVRPFPDAEFAEDAAFYEGLMDFGVPVALVKPGIHDSGLVAHTQHDNSISVGELCGLGGRGEYCKSDYVPDAFQHLMSIAKKVYRGESDKASNEDWLKKVHKSINPNFRKIGVPNRTPGIGTVPHDSTGEKL